MAFKLKFQGKGKNPYNSIVSKGLVTPVHLIEGPGDEKKEETLQSKADANAANAEKVLLKPGDKGYDPNKKASYVQKGTATQETPFTDEGNLAYKNMSQAERDAQDKKWKEMQSKNAEIFSYEDKDKVPPPDPEPDYSYLDGATFGSGYQSGDFTTYGLQLMSKVGDDDPRAKSQQREGPDPMSRYLTQKELDYLKGKGTLKGNYKSGYDDYYSGMNPESKGFMNAVKRGLIDESGKTIPLRSPELEKELGGKDNLLSESGLDN